MERLDYWYYPPYLSYETKNRERKNGLEHVVIGKGKPGERFSMGSQEQYEIIQHFREG